MWSRNLVKIPIFNFQPGLIGLVDYPDEDSDEDEEETSSDTIGPSPKRARLAT